MLSPLDFGSQGGGQASLGNIGLLKSNLCTLNIISIKDECSTPPLLYISSIEHCLSQGKHILATVRIEIILCELTAFCVVTY